ncbi:hypothetical protein ACH5BF_00570 [Arcobacter sp. YIC-464]|uniref:hypothetical protein n=1 Tax=Arcobacter sp. YIC-464 TaxID=3376631 RepID=UPI003C2010C8
MTNKIIINSLKKIENIFENYSVKYLLMNGNVEKVLKSFLGMCFENLDENYSYVMDKRVANHEIDMLAFNNGKELMAIEFKCTLSTDYSSSKFSSKKASEQIKTTLKIKELDKCKKYIIHFFNKSNPISNSSLNPKYIKDKYPLKSMSKEKLIEVYEENLKEFPIDISTYEYRFSNKDLGLDVLIIEIKDY